MGSMVALALLVVTLAGGQQPVGPVRVEVVNPIHQASFNKGGTARKRIQGGDPQTVDGKLMFFGSSDGDRQVDPQIAVGGGYVLEGTNGGLVIYDKQGHYVDGVPQREFNDGIDPKLFFDPVNRVFGFDLWVYWDKPKIKPVNISISETADPKGAWNTYPVPSREEVDGGAIGFSRKWIGYSYPGGSEGMFMIRMAEAKAGAAATVYHFKGDFGQPVYSQDPTDDLIFLRLTDDNIVLTTVGEGPDKTPVVKSVVTAPHHIRYFDWPPMAPMKGTDKRTAPGDRNPKNAVLQGKSVWFSQTVNIDGRAGVLWHEVRLDGKFIQDGLLSDPANSYIQTTIAVNKRKDALVGFQETGPNMDISARCAWRKNGEQGGTLHPIWKMMEGSAPTAGGAWGDYSGCCIDGDNLTDLWTIQSFANKAGRGATVIARIRP